MKRKRLGVQQKSPGMKKKLAAEARRRSQMGSGQDPTAAG